MCGTALEVITPETPLPSSLQFLDREPVDNTSVYDGGSEISTHHDTMEEPSEIINTTQDTSFVPPGVPTATTQSKTKVATMLLFPARKSAPSQQPVQICL